MRRHGMRAGLCVLVATVLAVLAGPASAQTIHLRLINARSVAASGSMPALAENAPVPAGTNYDYIINRDVTGDPLQGVGPVDAATGLRSYGRPAGRRPRSTSPPTPTAATGRRSTRTRAASVRFRTSSGTARRPT